MLPLCSRPPTSPCTHSPARVRRLPTRASAPLPTFRATRLRYAAHELAARPRALARFFPHFALCGARARQCTAL